MHTISIDKTDGFMIYLSKDSLQAVVVSAKSSEMNVLVPDSSGEFVSLIEHLSLVSICTVYVHTHILIQILDVYVSMTPTIIYWTHIST